MEEVLVLVCVLVLLVVVTAAEKAVEQSPASNKRVEVERMMIDEKIPRNVANVM